MPLPEHIDAPGDTFNFAQHLLTVNTQRPAKAAFIDDGGALTYGALDERVRRVAAGLRALGIKREERVLLLMQDCNDWPVSFLGAIYAGIVPVAVNTLLTADDYAYMLEHSRAQAVLVSGALLPAVTAAMTKSDHEVHKVIVSHPAAPLHPAEVEFESFVQGNAPLAKAAPPARTTPASGCIPRAPRGGPKARCIRTPTPTGRSSCMARAFWNCARAMCASRRPSCSLPMVWAMR